MMNFLMESEELPGAAAAAQVSARSAAGRFGVEDGWAKWQGVEVVRCRMEGDRKVN